LTPYISPLISRLKASYENSERLIPITCMLPLRPNFLFSCVKSSFVFVRSEPRYELLPVVHSCFVCFAYRLNESIPECGMGLVGNRPSVMSRPIFLICFEVCH
jgi:hypothetical protein